MSFSSSGSLFQLLNRLTGPLSPCDLACSTDWSRPRPDDPATSSVAIASSSSGCLASPAPS